MSADFVDLRDVRLEYGNETSSVLAVENLTMATERGQFAAVVGPSGCGKSTVMKLVTGLLPPTSGSVAVNGAKVTRPIPNVGMAFQNATLMPWRSTLDNVMLPFEIVDKKGLRADRASYVARVEKVLASVGLGGFGSKFPWQLSGGMQQRANVCRAIIHEPEILMLDEPFGALDAFTREELWGVMQNLWLERKFTAILVTHDLREAVFLADVVFVMSKRPGRIIYRRDIDLPRPRTIETCFEPHFVDIVHELRARISEEVKSA